MPTRHVLIQRLIAAALVVGAFAVAPAVGAQTCAYNSTQSTCACPTSGAGTTCFGGQIFKSTDNSCQNDIRPCSLNQNFDCSSAACVCNTASYPCGGCTAASSTVGASCSVPSGGQYTNVCGACACPSGTTLCSSSNACITNRTCPAGTTWDPCTDTCGTPNVLLSPGWIQSGFIQINGDVKSTAGNLRLDAATGVGQGDTYIANGKAIRVDGSGVTSLSFGNWGVGGTSVNVFHNGNVFATGGFSSMPGDTAVAANTIETGSICFGNGVNCRSSWPTTTDFDSTYVNAIGDTMTGTLTVSGTGSNVTVGGNVGIGTTSPNWRLEVSDTDTSTTAATKRAGLISLTDSGATASGTDYPIALSAIASKSNNAGATARIIAGDFTATNATQTAGTTYTYGASGTAYGADTNYGLYGYSNTTRGEAYGAYLVGDGTSTNSHYGVRADGRGAGANLYGGYFYANGTSTNTYGVYSNVNSSVGTNYGIYASATGAPTNYAGIFMGGNVGIGTATPTALLDVNGTAKMTGLLLPTGAAAGRFLTSDASGNASWSTSPIVSGSGTNGQVSFWNGTTTQIGDNNFMWDNTSKQLRLGGAGYGAATLDVRSNATYPAIIQGFNTGSGLILYTETAGTNDLHGALSIGRTTSGVAAAGLGTGVTFSLEDAGNSLYGSTGGMYNFWTDSSAVNRTSALSFWTMQSGNNTSEKLRIAGNGDVGIGTTSPAARLHVSGGSFLVDGASGGLPATGAGTRLMWYPAKAALRAGIIMTGRTEWDDANIGSNSVAFGLNSQALGTYSFANGNNTHANGDSSVAFGLSTFATNTGAFSAGNGNTASGYSAVAVGNNTVASGTHTLAYGSGSQATGDYSTAGGLNSVAGGNGTVAIGWGAHAAGGIGLGDNVYATGSDSVALGFASQATNTSATVSGYQSTGSGFATTAMGYTATASGYAATAFGQGTTAAGDRSVAMGYNSTANGPGSVALGAYNSTGTTGYATAVGYANSASGQYSFAGGYAATASGDMSFAYGQSPSATGYSSFSLGQYAYSTAAYSASYGNFLNTTGYRAMTIGNGYDGTAGGLLANSVGYSIMLGTNSNLPTMTITNGGGIGGIGSVGIGTTAPDLRLTVNGDVRVGQKGSYTGGVANYGKALVFSGANGLIAGYSGDNSDPEWMARYNSGSNTSELRLSMGDDSSGDSLAVGYCSGYSDYSSACTWTPTATFGANGDVALNGKHAFRANDSWLRLNQDGAFSSGVHTPGNFAPGALNVGGANGWGNPGSGNAWIAGNLVVYGSLYLSGWRSTWPYWGMTTSAQNLYASASGWQYPNCPGGYSFTGWAGYNCQSTGCTRTYGYSGGMAVWIDAGYTAYMVLLCGANF